MCANQSHGWTKCSGQRCAKLALQQRLFQKGVRAYSSGLVLPGVTPGEPDTPGPLQEAYAEALSDAVLFSAPLWVFCCRTCCFFPAEAPATSLQRIASGLQDKQPGLLGRGRSAPNASRNLHRLVNRWGLAWRPGFRTFTHTADDGTSQTVVYISPADYFKFLIEKAPELLMGGDVASGPKFLQEFWSAYRESHGKHRAFDFFDESDYHRLLPFCLHGDEGRGLRRGNTCVIMMEAAIGFNSASRLASKKSFAGSCQCCLGEPHAKRFRLTSGLARAVPPHECLEHLESNLKGHSFLSKFVLCGLPHKSYKLEGMLVALIAKISEELNQLFFQGVSVNGTTYHGIIIGLKGDLKWYEKISYLDRCFNRINAPEEQMCHECYAGDDQRPFEDIISRAPAWHGTEYRSRPWHDDPPFLAIPFDPNCPEKILRRDVFHNGRLGTLRDFVGSAVVILARLKYFHINQPNVSNKFPLLLQRAHDHFAYFCQTTGRTAALRSFTKEFMNAPSFSKYPWCNCKASDTTILVEWIGVFAVACMQSPVDEVHLPLLQGLRDAARCAGAWHKHVYSHGIFWNQHCAATFLEHFEGFLEAYHQLAWIALHDFQIPAFGMKPKAHLLKHVAVETDVWITSGLGRIPSPILFACDQNEDVVGKVSRLSRRVSARHTSQRVLDLYLIKCKILHNRFRRSKR